MAQYGGGQEDQISQLIAAYAQMSGLDPQEIIQKLQSLPQDQQQQALQAIAQQVQQAMAQQQGGAGQEQMGMAKMGGYPNYMAEGGEPCYECFDHYNPSPQAQDLNWYYKKAKGGLTKAARGNQGECPNGYLRDHGGRCVPGPEVKEMIKYRDDYDPAVDSQDMMDDLSKIGRAHV